jgi:hypothetical protein
MASAAVIAAGLPAMPPYLGIELLFPADRATAELLKNLPTDAEELLALARELGGAQ